jgi:WD40 repeat protein
MKFISKYYHHPYFIYFLQLFVLLIGALFFAGGCPDTTTEFEDKTVPPNPPTVFTVTSISENSLRIEWPKEYKKGTYFNVERADSIYSFIQIGVVEGTTASFTDYGLSRSNTYYYRVRTVRDSLVGQYSKTITVGYSLSVQLLRSMNNNGWQSLLMSTDGTYLVSYGNSNMFNIWNTSNWSVRTLTSSPDGIIAHAVFSGNTNDIVTSEGFRSPLPVQIKIWRSSDGQLIRTIVLDSTYISVNSMAVTYDGAILAAANNAGRLCLWNLTDGSFVQLLDTINSYLNTSTWDVAISPSANILVALSIRSMKIWNLDTKQINYTLSGHFYHPVFNQAGSRLMVNYNNRATSYRTSDWIPVYSLDTAQTVVAFSPNDSLLAFADLNIVRIARGSDGSLLQSIYAHSGSILSIVFFPTGQQFASSSSDGTTKIWSLSQVEQWHIVE